MTDSISDSVKSKKSGSSMQPGIVAGGKANLMKGYQSEARRFVEAKYAEQWNASGLLQRWWLQRKMEREIAERIAQSMPNVSQEALF
jgi:hypothetical protein